ncbi:GNAT family N-acetyltransferase [Methylobacterium gossipiicola]|uniref:Acetyltransferase involved in cellulose biosynthesis, CelD/BcsL family n=1 Tax=Methylobacterium gossipiicola TaxID=582675 RepID=A0A1I2VWB9_9HYPH|nr:GNAT family N-acetyltransferase [Methylobacterium gossipiicola]SFG93393.1 Acetyltransferase involved in cellulose biosynthesis, CelD/BcsL family [Methylobacterium gossipiicola]
MIQDTARSAPTTEVYSDLASVEALWRSLESDPTVFATPYQRFDWVAAYAASEPDVALRVFVLRDGSGRPQALIPCQVAREYGLRVARVIGARHANFHMPLFASRAAAADLRPEDLVERLRSAARSDGIDVYAFSHQPLFWDGAANPLGIQADPSPSDAYGLLLGPDADATLKRVFSADARKKLRAKEKKLVEAFGPVAYRVARTDAEAAAYLGAFYIQKAARFATLGIANPYADARIRDFIAAGARRDVRSGEAAIEVAALVGLEGERVFAVFAGAVDTDRYSGMMTSFDQDPSVSRSSPGDILLQYLIRDQATRGRRALDLGVGEARYKTNTCDETIRLGETTVPVTLPGYLFALKTVGTARLKRRIKRNPRVMALIGRLRRRRRGGGQSFP